MELPVQPPIAPMLARLARRLPADGFLYEPKWDGFRCLAFRSDDEVDLRSRHERPLARYFPELVRSLRSLARARFVLDGEVVVLRSGALDFDALLARLHPAASRVERLSAETPAAFIAFDLLALGDEDLRQTPFAERRARLAELLAAAEPPLFVTPLTDDRGVASRWLRRFQGAGIDGVVAKHSQLAYEPAKRMMVKVKHERTADVVVAGFRLLVDRPLPSSLLLGLYDEEGKLRHVGLAAGLREGLRRDLLAVLAPLAVPLAGHPWERGFLVEGSRMGRLKGAAARWHPEEMEHDWVPVDPNRVCEVAYDGADAARFRHPARFRRWRPDRDPRSCRLEQLAAPPPAIGELLARG